MLEQIANKWSVLILTVLCSRPSRFNEIMRRLDGITHKALSEALKRLERNGLIHREVLTTTTPVGVEYTITRSAAPLQQPFEALYCVVHDLRSPSLSVHRRNTTGSRLARWHRAAFYISPDTFTTSLPKFLPSRKRMNTAGAFSSPSGAGAEANPPSRRLWADIGAEFRQAVLPGHDRTISEVARCLRGIERNFDGAGRIFLETERSRSRPPVRRKNVSPALAMRRRTGREPISPADKPLRCEQGGNGLPE